MFTQCLRNLALLVHFMCPNQAGNHLELMHNFAQHRTTTHENYETNPKNRGIALPANGGNMANARRSRAAETQPRPWPPTPAARRVWRVGFRRDPLRQSAVGIKPSRPWGVHPGRAERRERTRIGRRLVVGYGRIGRGQLPVAIHTLEGQLTAALRG